MEGAGNEPDPQPVPERRIPSSPLSITTIEVDHPHRADRNYLHPGEPLTLRIGFQARRPVDDVMVGIAIYDHATGVTSSG